MLSKILIDVNEIGFSTIKVLRPSLLSPDMDVRDKLVNRFLEGGSFAVITRCGENNDAEIRSMNGINVMENVLKMYIDFFENDVSEKEFEQAILKVCHLIDNVTDERLTDFLKKCASKI